MASTDSEQFKTGGKKFNFVCAKRTFSMLLSPYFDKYTENLICGEIVLKMGLPIFDRKCETLSISGIKTEAVGFIKTTVQCLKSGIQTGTIYIKAKVVRDFYKLFGYDGLCSEKLGIKVSPPTKTSDDIDFSDDTIEEQENTEPKLLNDATAKRVKKMKPKALKNSSPSSTSSTPSLPITPSPRPALPNETPGIRNLKTGSPLLPPGFLSPYLPSTLRLKSPPGFLTAPSCINPPPIKVPYDLPMQPNTAMMSPYSVNISRLTASFGDADILNNFAERSGYLQQLDPGGKLDRSKNGVSFAFYKSRDPTSSPSMTHSAVYRSGHGRTWCRMACKDSKLFSHNCGHHTQWKLPLNFQYCSTECKGGLCECLRDYSDYGYYG